MLGPHLHLSPVQPFVIRSRDWCARLSQQMVRPSFPLLQPDLYGIGDMPQHRWHSSRAGAERAADSYGRVPLGGSLTSGSAAFAPRLTGFHQLAGRASVALDELCLLVSSDRVSPAGLARYCGKGSSSSLCRPVLTVTQMSLALRCLALGHSASLAASASTLPAGSACWRPPERRSVRTGGQ
jgi:hypothetical protein